jgi:hypothetical protein
MYNFDKNIGKFDKLLTIIAYMLFSQIPMSFIVVYFLNRNNYPKMHFNRIFFFGFLYFFDFILIMLGKNSLFFLDYFVGITIIIGMVQTLFGEDTRYFFFDRFVFVQHEGRNINSTIQILLTVMVLAISIMITM